MDLAGDLTAWQSAESGFYGAGLRLGPASTVT